MSLSHLPHHIIQIIANYGIHWLPTNVCKSWKSIKHIFWTMHATRIQLAYRNRRDWYNADSHDDVLIMSHANLMRMYLVHYPFEYLQRWPNLALVKCPDITELQHKKILSLPTTTQRTRRDLRDLLLSLTVAQITYVGW